MQKPTIFSLGYECASPTDFLRTLAQIPVDVVIDVRESPVSRRPRFSKLTLSNALESIGVTYLHLPEFGTPTSLRLSNLTTADCLNEYREYLWANPQLLRRFDNIVGDQLAAAEAVCLICYERSASDCHRSVLLDEYQQIREFNVVHLTAAPPRVSGSELNASDRMS